MVVPKGFQSGGGRLGDMETDGWEETVGERLFVGRLVNTNWDGCGVLDGCGVKDGDQVCDGSMVVTSRDGCGVVEGDSDVGNDDGIESTLLGIEEVGTDGTVFGGDTGESLTGEFAVGVGVLLGG